MSLPAEAIVGGGSLIARYGTNGPSGPGASSVTAEVPSATAPAHVARAGSYARRLHRIEGQVRGIERMLVEERECVDVLTQIAAARMALERLALQLLDTHMARCLAAALASGDPTVIEARRDELLGAVERFVRTR